MGRLTDRIQTRDPEFDALRRAARAALTLPVSAAIGLTVGGTQTPLYTIFGSIALLIVVDFPGNRAGRALSYAGLGAIGAVLITLGTLVSSHATVAVATMFAVGIAVTFAGVLSTAIAAGQRATLLTFVLPACTPAGPVDERLLGWGIALAVCVPAALWLFPPRHHDELRRLSATVCAVLAGRLEGRNAGREVNAAMNALYAHYLDGDFRPVGLTAGSRALVRVVDDLGWLSDRVDDDTAAVLGDMTEPAVRVLRACARLLRVRRVIHRLPDRRDLETALDEMRTVAQGRYRDDIAKILRQDDDAAAATIGARLLDRRVFGATVAITGRVIATAAAADARPAWMRVLGLRVPEAGAAVRVLSERQAVTSIPTGYLATGAVVIRSSLRTGLGLAAAVATTHIFPVQHGFWVVLAAMSVLRSSALTTGTKVVRAVSGTVVGFVLGAVLIELLGVDPVVLWTVLPLAAFVAAYVPEVASFAAGQAAFTMLVLIVFNLIHPTGWAVGLIRIEDIVVGGAVGLVVSLLLWPRGSGRAVSVAIDRADEAGRSYLRAAVHRITSSTAPDDADLAGLRELGYQSLTAARTVDAAVRQYLSEGSGKLDQSAQRAPVIRRANRVTRLRSAADLIVDIPNRPTPGSYPGTRAILEQHAAAAGDPDDTEAGRSTDLTERFVTTLRAESGSAARPVADALPLVTVAANLGGLDLHADS